VEKRIEKDSRPGKRVRSRQPRPLEPDMANSRKWAIITGASSGIGKALAFQFAAGGFNLVLTARNESALNDVAAQCARQYSVDVEVIPADLARTESIDSLIDAISAKSQRYEVLVNNAGFGIHGDFVSGDIERDLQLVNVQIAAALRLTKAVLPTMIS